MSKRILALIGILMALGLTACNQNTANNMNNQRKANTQKQGLTTKLNAPEQASAFIIYAAMKYKGHWQKLYQRAQATKLSVSVKNHTGFRVKSKDYIYEASDDGKEADTFYTVKDDQITWYTDKKKQGSAELSNVVNYLNSHEQANQVKQLAAITKIGAAITSDKYGVKGDNGLSFIPKSLRGTWYNRQGKKLVVTDHTINGEEIHMIDNASFAPVSFKQTEKWARARMENINGIDCYHVQSLNQQGFGLLYTVQKKDGEHAIATYSVDTGDFTGSYWKSIKSAKINRDAVFASLK